MEIKCTIAYKYDWQNYNERDEVVLTEEDILKMAGEKLKNGNDLIHLDIDNSSIDNVGL